jgi:hypothetical protein
VYGGRKVLRGEKLGERGESFCGYEKIRKDMKRYKKIRKDTKRYKKI